MNFGFNAETAQAMGNVIDLLGSHMEMFLCAGTGGQTGFRKALIADSGITRRE